MGYLENSDDGVMWISLYSGTVWLKMKIAQKSLVKVSNVKLQKSSSGFGAGTT